MQTLQSLIIKNLRKSIYPKKGFKLIEREEYEMIELIDSEYDSLRSQFATLESGRGFGGLNPKIVFSLY